MWLRPEHPLHALQTRAAQGGHRPVLVAWASDEAGLEPQWDAIEAALGPLPQAAVVEPLGPGDWALRVPLPGASDPPLSPAGLALPGPWALVPGWSDGRDAAWDRGWLTADTIAFTASGVPFVAERALADGEPARPELARPPTRDPVLDAVAAAIAAHLPGVILRSDAGPGTIAPVVHRSTGRFGIEACAETDPEALLRAVASVVVSGAGSAAPLAPDLAWDQVMGATVVRAWFALPATDPLPIFDASWAAPADAAVEHQLLPERPAAHDVLVDAAQRWAATHGLAGGRGRWWRGAWAPAWVGVAPAPRLPGLAAHRTVPDVPTGLADRAPVLDPVHHGGASRCLSRWRDAVIDRDRAEVVDDRPRTPRDAEVDVHAVAALAAHGARGLLPADGMPSRALVAAGRSGIELAFDPGSFTAEGLRPILDALCAVRHEDVRPTGTWAHRADRTIVRLWFGDAVDDWA